MRIVAPTQGSEHSGDRSGWAGMLSRTASVRASGVTHVADKGLYEALFLGRFSPVDTPRLAKTHARAIHMG